MAKSMTGYGAASGTVDGGQLQIEIRTVNHRHFSASLKLCTRLQPLEIDVRNRLRERLPRGHVTLTARWLEDPPRTVTPLVNLDRAREIAAAMRQLKDALDLPGEVDLAFVARQPEVFSVPSAEEASASGDAVAEIVERALEDVIAMRLREGETLRAELLDHVGQLERDLAEVGARAPERLVAERERLRTNVTDLLDGRAIDENRIAFEIAVLADKLDITEEMVRLRAHCQACRETLDLVEPIGRKLGFLGQEMLREINTIGSKANDATIARSVIAMKGAVEKFREQVENLE